AQRGLWLLRERFVLARQRRSLQGIIPEGGPRRCTGDLDQGGLVASGELREFGAGRGIRGQQKSVEFQVLLEAVTRNAAVVADGHRIVEEIPVVVWREIGIQIDQLAAAVDESMEAPAGDLRRADNLAEVVDVVGKALVAAG